LDASGWERKLDIMLICPIYEELASLAAASVSVSHKETMMPSPVP
jgi:hypothetical protein